MREEAIRFISEIVKPWEILNRQLSAPFSINSAINDFITNAHSLTVSMKHLPEVVSKTKPADLSKESIYYEIISDLADSLKHGTLRQPQRECKLTTSSMFERNSEAKVRFLRNRISIYHNTHGKIDFMECAMECAIFIAEKLNIKTDWNPQILNNYGEFSDEIKIHASKQNQIVWTEMSLEFVKRNIDDKLENVDLDGSVKFTLTSEF